MPTKPTASQRPKPGEIGSFLGYLTAGVVLAYLLYAVLAYVSLMIDKGVTP